MPDLDPRKEFESLKARTLAALTAQFPISGRTNRIEMLSIQIDERAESPEDTHHIDNLAEQLKAKLRGGSWSLPIKGKLRLVRIADEHVIDTSTVLLAHLPKITSRYSYIVAGHERQHDSLFRSKSRPYHLVANDGSVVARWNVAKGVGFDLIVDPTTGRMQLKYRTSHIPLYPVLNALGVTDDEMRKQWGDKVLAANKARINMVADLGKLHRTATKQERGVYKPPPLADLQTFTRDLFAGTQLRPDGMRAAFGREFDHVNGEGMMLSTGRILGIASGRQEPDDRQALSAKDFVSTDDFVVEFIEHAGREMAKKIKANLDRKDKVADIVGGGPFSKAIAGAFEAAQRPEQTNPLTFISGYLRTTIRGAAFGGVKGEQTNLDKDKLINPTHLGFLDPVQTPEGEDTGIALHLPLGVRRAGKELEIEAYDVRSKGMRWVRPGDLERENVTTADQVEWVGGHPKPRAPFVTCYDKDRRTSSREWKDVRYVLRSSKNLFSMSAIRIPFLQNDQGNRAQFGAKQQEQAISLKYREAPLVQSQSESHETYDGLLGQFASHRAPVDGVVAKIEKDKITLTRTDGKPQVVHVYDHFPLNGGKMMLHAEPVVKVGQRVKKGDLLADTNFTKGGVYADGINTRVAYTPFHGLNFEDGIVASESFAKRATSEHLHVVSAFVAPTMVLDTRRWVDYVNPEKALPARLAKLDAKGVIKVGETVTHGDVLIALLAPSGVSKDDEALAQISRKLVRDFKDRSEVWDHDYPGKVVRVVRMPDAVTVHVRTEEPLAVGDKLSGRHGNKGIVSRILPDSEMPHTKDGVAMELLLNPAGVPSRMNLGQALESAAGRIAQKTGKPYVTSNFTPGKDYMKDMAEELKKHGLNPDSTEVLYDPATKSSIGPVFVGVQHMLKLHHVVDKKMTALGVGTAFTPHGAPPSGAGVPGGGQKMDQLTTYAMLAHGAKENLREAYTFKSDADQADMWLALQTGQPLPPPRTRRVVGHFLDYLRGMGIHVNKDAGDKYQMGPLTDKQTKALSNGALRFSDKMLQAKGDRTLTEPGGLFDNRITGGLEGKFWSHIDLHKAIPNPIFEKPICRLLGINEKEFEKLTGPELVDGKSGFEAITSRLAALDVKKELAAAEASLAKQPVGARLDQAYQKVRYLRALKATGLTPVEAYTNKALPVIPPAIRRVSVGIDGSQIVDDINALYRTIGQVNHQIGIAHKSTPPGEMQKLHSALYASVKSLRVTGADLGEGSLRKHHNGIMEKLVGLGGPKTSFFHQNVMGPRQMLSGRSTIIPKPELNIDEVGLPLPMALEMYKPFVVRNLHVNRGYSPLEAQKMVREKDPLALQALEEEVAGRPILLKRDPALHMFSIMAFQPKITTGKAVGLHPLSCGGFNADFDGDSCYARLLVVDRAAGDGYVDGMPHVCCLPSTARTVHIKDFPHLTDTATAKEGGVLEFDVPAGVSVPAYRTTETGEGVIEMRPVSKWSIHPACVEWVVTSRRGRRLVVSEDHSLALLDPETLEVVRAKPEQAERRCFPVLASIEETGQAFSPVRIDSARTRANYCVPEVPLTREVGWLIGATAGDGWVTAQGQVSLAYGEGGGEVAARWEAAMRTLGEGACGDIRQPHTFDGHPCVSIRRTFTNSRLARWMEAQIGHGAANKHLPPGFLGWPLEARRGLFEGLIDTDGTAYWSEAGRFGLAYTTISEDLANDVSLLAMSLGLIVSETETTKRDKPAYLLSFSVSRVQQATWLALTAPTKAAALERLRAAPAKGAGHTDFVPMTERVRSELLQSLKEAGATRKKDKNAAAFSLYVILRKQEPTLSRESYLNLWTVLDKGAVTVDAYMAKWAGLCDAPVGWDLIESAAPTGAVRTMYDLTVPDAWTFCTADGAVVWDSMALYVPNSPAAVEEAKRMFPSKSLFSPTHGGLMPKPGQDGLVGLFQMVQWGQPLKGPGRPIDDLLKDMMQGKLPPQTVIPGPDGRPTTLGRVALHNALPASMKPHEKLLHDQGLRLDSKGLDAMLTEIGKKDPQGFGPCVDVWKNLGNRFSYLQSASFKLSDFSDGSVMRDDILKPYRLQEAKIRASGESQAEIDKKVVALYFKAQEELKDKLTAMYKSTRKNNLFNGWIDSGARGSWTQFGQLVSGAVLVTDASNKPVSTPILRSLGEGLGTMDYWTHMHGARKGTLDRASGTADPGALTKDIINTTMPMAVTAEDCGTTTGVLLPITDKDLEGRFTAGAQALPDKSTLPNRTLLTADLLRKLQGMHLQSLNVRTTMHCAQVKGVCATCFGHNENGRLHAVGVALGVRAGHALGEPVTQLAMKCSAGVVVLAGGDAAALDDVFTAAYGAPPSAEGVVAGGTVDLTVLDAGAWVTADHVEAHLPEVPMLFLRTRGGRSMVVQADHPLWVYAPDGTSAEMPAGEVRVGTLLRADDSACTAPDAEPPHFPGYVVGFFLAEGSTRVGNGTPAYADRAVASVFTQADGPCKDRLLLELAETPEFPHASSRPEDVQVYSPAFAEGLREVVRGRGAHTKRLCPGFNRWPHAYQAQVLGAWIDGDGTVFYKSGVTVAKLYTSSYVALQQAEILCRRAGLRFSPVYVHRPDTTVQVQSRHASFAVEIRFEDTESARAVWAASVKLSGLGPLLFAKQRRRDTAALDPVTRVRQIDKWVLPVYDLRTSTAGYTCGTLRNHNTFHTGGAASSEEGLMDSFKRAKQLFKVPKVLPGQAVLSTVSGKVDSVVHDPVLGGHEIKVDGVMHYVPAARKVKVAKGDLVTPGHALSSGPSNPVELLKLTKSMSKVREYLASELIGAYQQGGGKVQRRNVETVVRAMTNLTRIDDPGDHKEYTRGDYAPLTEVQSKNLAARSAGLTPIKHTAALKPMTEVPLLQTEDFMARLNYARLETTYLEGAAQGWSSDIHGHPVPGLVHGAQFGHTPGAPAAPPAPSASRMPVPPPPFAHPVPKGPAPTVHAGWSTPARPAPAVRAGSGATSALPGVNPLWRR